MLKWMKLKNLALVEEADIEFGDAFNVISGETGAGKSVIMGAVGLLLGARADKSSIRIGSDKCEISAEFILAEENPQIRNLLRDAAVESEETPDSILVRRVITENSTRNFINGSPVNLQTLRALGELLIDIHAANENQSLMKPAEQLLILDRFGGLESTLNAVCTVYEALKELREKKKAFLESMPSAEEAERMRCEVREIEKANPYPDEDEELKRKHALASHARTILEIASRVNAALSESENSVCDRISEVRRMLLEMERVDSANASAFVGRIEEISDSLSTLASDLCNHASSVELDEAEFFAIEERMRVLQTLKRRYGPSIEDVLGHLTQIREKIAEFDSAEQFRKDFDERETVLALELRKTSEELSSARKNASEKLLKLLSAETRKLGFKKAEFDIVFEEGEPSAHGFDRIQILFTANPGVPLKPLRDVASSGEISRVMLAMKTVLAEADSIPVLIFDEIDANIGGETAMKVGQELRKLATHKQLICISHLPQVAHHADTHFLVRKSSSDDVTRSSIEKLSEENRIQEIARMLGGGAAALEHARSMLNSTERAG